MGLYNDHPVFDVPCSFEEYKMRIALGNSEDFVDFKDESIETYYSNLCLMLTENSEKMLKEANRGLKKGERAGFGIWGKLENSQINKVLQGLLQNLRSMG